MPTPLKMATSYILSMDRLERWQTPKPRETMEVGIDFEPGRSQQPEYGAGGRDGEDPTLASLSEYIEGDPITSGYNEILEREF